jgi:hypothetical protein
MRQKLPVAGENTAEEDETTEDEVDCREEGGLPVDEEEEGA